MDDIASLITMAAGQPILGAGQHPILPPPGENIPTTADLIKATVGPVRVVSPAAPATPLSAGPALPSQQLPPLVAGPANLVVTDSGTGRPPTACSFNAAAAPPPQAPVQAAAPAPAARPPENDDRRGFVTQSSGSHQCIAAMAAADAKAAVIKAEDGRVMAATTNAATLSVPFDAEADEEGGFDSDAEFAGLEDHMEQPAAPQSATSGSGAPGVAQPVAAQPPTPDPIAKALEASAPAVAIAPQPVAQKMPGDDALSHIQQIQQWISVQVQKAMFDCGMTLLSDQSAKPAGSYLHEVIYRMRWRTLDNINLGPQELLAMEQVLTAHQVYVASQENYWRARYDMIGRDLDRLIFIKRENYAGTTKTASENALIAAEPAVRQMRNDYLLSQAMSTLYSDMGERFGQMEDGLKRTVTFAVNEYERSKIQAKYQ